MCVCVCVCVCVRACVRAFVRAFVRVCVCGGWADVFYGDKENISKRYYPQTAVFQDGC